MDGEVFEVAVSSGERIRGWHWSCEGADRALTIMTGMDEYARRYEDLAGWMNERGVDVWCLDAFGQGLNAASIDQQEIWPEDAFAKNVDAIREMIRLAGDGGKKRVIQMGHSMGSFMVQSLIERYPGCADRVILCGSNGGQYGMMRLAYLLAKTRIREDGRQKPAPDFDRLGLGPYAKAVKNRRTDFDWISFNEENVDAYIADPYCGHGNTGGFWIEFLKGMSLIWHPAYLKKISPEEHILIVAGAEDPVGRNGKGPKWLEKTYRKLGVRDVRLKLYPGMRHEIHNEKDRLSVYEDLLAFLKQ